MNLVITDEDRKTYGSLSPGKKSKSLIPLKGPDKSAAVSKPLDLPRIPTIDDLRIENKLTESDILTIRKLDEIYPKISFDNITPAEALDLEKYGEIVGKMSRAEIWKAIKPYFFGVFKVSLGDQFSKMTDIAKRSEHNPDYLPTMEWIKVIAGRILQARHDLFSFNVDMKIRKFDYRENPIAALLMLMKVQKEIYPKRKNKISENNTAKFKELAEAHAELMIKLKMHNKTGEDFFGSKYFTIKDRLRKMRSLSFKTFWGKSLTIDQQTNLITIIDDYQKTLGMIFTYNNEDEEFYNMPLCRPANDIKLAALEMYYMFDDSCTNNRALMYKAYNTEPTACEIINSLYITGELNRPISRIYKNGISMDGLAEYIEQYFSFDQMDRFIIRQKSIATKPTTYTKILELSFDLLDKYTEK